MEIEYAATISVLIALGKKSHLADTTQDEQAWNRFIAAVEQWKGELLQLFIIPYGEALIHR